MGKLEDVKLYLAIDWEDERTDANIKGIIARAERVLNGYAGECLSYLKDSEEYQLLLDCSRYIYNHALEDFKLNFAEELLLLRANNQIKRMELSDCESNAT